MVDLTVAAVPFYFGSMGVEYVALKKRAETEGPSSSDYVRNDTLANLAMGVGSLLMPLVSQQIVSRVAPGKGKYGKALLGTVAVSAAVTTLADLLATKLQADEAQSHSEAQSHPDLDGGPVEGARLSRTERRRRVRKWARNVASVGGVSTIASGTLAAASFFASRTSAKQYWAKGGAERDLGESALAWTTAILTWDFIYYWNHRSWHEIRAMWAIHVVHHSSERYNLSTALRQPVSDLLGVWVPYGLASAVGVRPRLVMQARAINLIYQFWIHTDMIRSLGPFEKVLNTASHHRVHHGRNPQYLDRNHGSILIIWDKLFGTFEPEGEPVIYGLTKNIHTDNPLKIASSEYKDIVADVMASENWTDRLSFVLRGPGWAYNRQAELALASAE